jgi:hypothetical protein
MPSARCLRRSTREETGSTAQFRWVFWACLLGSIAPDFDLIWFYGIDGRAFHHHNYWVHMPAFWLLLAGPILALAHRLNRLRVATGFLLAIALHLVLDSLVGGIAWLWPFHDTLYALAEVPATQAHWLLSFAFHWSFLLEILICSIGLFLAVFHKRKPSHA